MRRMRHDVREELDSLSAQSADGRLYPDMIVERAKNPKSPLHEHFTWDDSSAARMWRMEEARTLIRSYHVVIRERPVLTTRAFVSLRQDRKHGGGYLPVERVLTDEDLHRELLQDALAELDAVERRYAHVAELADVFAEVKKVRRRAARSTKRKEVVQAST